MLSNLDISLKIRNNRNYPINMNIMGSPINPLDTSNAKTEYRWDITSFTPTASDTVSIQYKFKTDLNYTTFNYVVPNPSPQSLIDALNSLGIGYFATYTELGQTYISTNNDNYDFADLTITSNVVPPALILTFPTIGDANALVGDATNVNDWNTYFNLPTLGNPFTSLAINGAEISLIGGSAITLKTSLFYSTNILSVDDQASCVILGNDYAFDSCAQLTYVNFPVMISTNDNTVGGCFSNCPLLNTLIIPSLNSVGSGGYTFSGCTSITSFSFPFLTSVTNGCFNGCTSVTSFNLPLITSVGNFSFQNCNSVTSFSFPLLTTIGNSSFVDLTSVNSFNFPLLNTIGDTTFQNCTSITNFNFPLLTIAGNNSFALCTGILTFNLSSLTTVGNFTFFGCSNANTFNFPSLNTIGNSSFEQCFSATTFNLSSCNNLGGSVLDNNVFNSIIGNTITLTVPIALTTCNGGLPDGDIQYLQANDTLTIITV
jgi:hypothetical protein